MSVPYATQVTNYDDGLLPGLLEYQLDEIEVFSPWVYHTERDGQCMADSKSK